MLETNSLDISQLPLSIQSAVGAIPKSDRYFVALSGGLDSMALLTLALPFLVKKYQATIDVIHVHHGLSPYADDWAAHCLTVSQALGLECHVERVDVVSQGKGVEAAAREARYAVFKRYLEGGGVLLQGHHLDDQAETVLLRLLRGAGPEGLSGIPQQRALSGGWIFRPWLAVPRVALENEIKKRAVKWVEDESNGDVRFDRNYLRHEVLPVIAKRWPNVLNSLSRTAMRSGQSHQHLVSWCALELKNIECTQNLPERALDLKLLAAYTNEQQRFLVRYWLDDLNVEHPPEKVFERLWSEVIVADGDALPALRWGKSHLRRYDGTLFYLNDRAVDERSYHYPLTVEVSDNFEGRVGLGCHAIGGRTLSASYQSSAQSTQDKVRIRVPRSNEKVIIRSRKGGESMVLTGSAQNKALKKLLQAQKIAPWRRIHLPLVYYGDVLVLAMLGGGQYLVANGFLADAGSAAIEFCWE